MAITGKKWLTRGALPFSKILGIGVVPGLSPRILISTWVGPWSNHKAVDRVRRPGLTSLMELYNL